MAKKKRTNEIHARIKTVNGNDEVVRFTYANKLPDKGSVVPGTEYHYGQTMQCELSPRQNTRDESILGGYTFYIAPIYNRDNQYVGRGCFCIDHIRSKIITPAIYQEMLRMAKEYDNVDAFVSDALDSQIWEEEDVSPLGREDWLRNIYVAVNRTMKDIVAETGLSQAKFGEFFGIPKRSIENWCTGAASPLPYLPIMMQEILGLVSRN